jgi:hypothetical protein
LTTFYQTENVSQVHACTINDFPHGDVALQFVCGFFICNFFFIYRCPQKIRRVHKSLIYRRILIIYTYTTLNCCEEAKGPTKFTYSLKGFKAKLSKYFFSNGNTYFFLAIVIYIFILKTTMYHKYTLVYQKYRAFI